MSESEVLNRRQARRTTHDEEEMQDAQSSPTVLRRPRHEKGESAGAGERRKRRHKHRKSEVGEETPFLGDSHSIRAPAEVEETEEEPPSEQRRETVSEEEIARHFNPEDLAALKEELEKLQASRDPRVDYDPVLSPTPAWVGRWAHMVHYSFGGRVGGRSRLLPASASSALSKGEFSNIHACCVSQLQEEIREVERFISDITLGTEGGFFARGSKTFEDPGLYAESTASSKRYVPPPIWLKEGAAMERALELRDVLVSKLQLLQERFPVCGYSTVNGEDGRQSSHLPPACEVAKDHTLRRCLIEEVFAGVEACNHSRTAPTTLSGPGVTTAAPSGLTRIERTEHAVSKIPIVHSAFLVDDDGPRMHLDALNFPDLLAPATGRDRSDNGLRRTITINVNFARFTEHDRFTQEHYHASELLDAYERYRLLASNQMPQLKSRRFYEQLLSTIEGEEPPHPYLTVVSELHERTCEMEASCLRTMIRAWGNIQKVREDKGQRYTRIHFCLTQHGDVEQRLQESIHTTSHSADDVLNYIPHLTEMEAGSAGTPYHGDEEMEVVDPQNPQPGRISSRVPSGKLYSVAVQAQLTSSKPPQEVGRTEKRPCNTTFSAVFNETFELRTQHDPVQLTLKLIDEGKGVCIASVNIPHSLSHAAHLVPFTTHIQFNTPEGSRHVSGVLSVSTTWTTVAGLAIEGIENLFLRGELDPMDPRNDALIKILGKYYAEKAGVEGGRQGGAGNRTTSPDRRRKSQVYNRRRSVQGSPAALAVADDSPFDEAETSDLVDLPKVLDLDRRLEVLRRRWLISKGLVNATDEVEARLISEPLPHDESGVVRLQRDIRREEEKRSLESASTAMIKQDGLSEWQRRIRHMQLTQQKRRPLKDHELQAKHLILPTIPTPKRLLSRLVGFLAPRSALNPPREERLDRDEIRAQLAKPAKDSNGAKVLGSIGDSQIIVHILKVSGLPSRQSEEPLEPFIVSSFIDCTASTRVESGSNPAFFQTTNIKFDPTSFDDDTLSLIDDDIRINIYDKVEVSLPPASVPQGANPSVTHYRLERRLIGSVKIPFYSLYCSASASIEGVFDIQVPRWVMGYKARQDQPPTLHAYVSLWPPLNKKEDDPIDPQEIMSQLSLLPSSIELHSLHLRALQWKSECERRVASIIQTNPLAKRRQIDPFVAASSGDLTLVCRYLSAGGTKPPPGITSVAAAIRYVSLMPFVVDMLAWNDARDVWSTNAEFLQMGAGDYEELAVLLVHFLRYLAPNEQTYLVVGEGKVFTQAVFVLHSQGDSTRLIDPRTGSVFDLDNPRSGIDEVSAVISDNQVWGNVQLSGSPHRMMWYFHDERYWAPLLDPRHEHLAPYIQTVQRPILEYLPVDPRQEAELEAHVKKTVKKCLQAWRNGKQPNFQQRVGSLLKEVLVDMERERFEHANFQQQQVNDSQLSALSEFNAQYEPIGVPVNVPYTDDSLKGLIDALHETSVHEIGTDAVLFGLGVYVKAYTRSVVSVWVYLVGLVSNDPRGRL